MHSFKESPAGDTVARCDLGGDEASRGVPQDYGKAAEGYRKSAEQGNADAQFNLGRCYAVGRGVPQDYSKAAEWWRKSAEQGNADAQYFLGWCYDYGGGVSEDHVKAAEWYRKAAEQGNAAGQGKLGYCYEIGHGIDLDYVKAVEWYRKAAEQGNVFAQSRLAHCYDNGRGVGRDHAKAAEWRRKSAEQGNARAQSRHANDRVVLKSAMANADADSKVIQEKLNAKLAEAREEARRGEWRTVRELALEALWLDKNSQEAKKLLDEAKKDHGGPWNVRIIEIQSNGGFFYKSLMPLDGLSTEQTGEANDSVWGFASGKSRGSHVWAGDENGLPKNMVALEGFKGITLPGNVRLEMILVEAGTYTMAEGGYGEEISDEIAHQVTLPGNFFLGRTEVTQGQWMAVMRNNPSRFSKGDNYPVDRISWYEAMAFCNKLNAGGYAPAGYMFTLPTEAQWEYAARGGKKSRGYKYSGSNDCSAVAWYIRNTRTARGQYRITTQPVGTKIPNELGFCDMSGNLYEWCLDDYEADNRNAKPEFLQDAGRVSGRLRRVLRGGCWKYGEHACCSVARTNDHPNSKSDMVGFRLALVRIPPLDGRKVVQLRKYAEQGDAGAQYQLGYCYYTSGRGIPQDYIKAAEWYQKSAEQGEVIAQFALANCYFGGNGVPQDYAKAAEWYRKAAEQGHAQSQCNLGECYGYGRGIPQNYEKAVEWYRKAAEQGHAQSQCNLGRCYGDGRGVPQDYGKALEWLRMSAAQNYAPAQLCLGYCHEYGWGVPQNYMKAAEWVWKAAENGMAEAQYVLGCYYYCGLGVPMDSMEAARCFERSRKQGYVPPGVK